MCIMCTKTLKSCLMSQFVRNVSFLMFYVYPVLYKPNCDDHYLLTLDLRVLPRHIYRAIAKGNGQNVPLTKTYL